MKFEVDKKRWDKAQELELEDWKNNDIEKLELTEIKKKYSKILSEISQKLNLNKNWRILDIGCGPTCISQFFPDAQKMGIDPLAKELKIDGKKINDVAISYGRGEEIPFDKSSFDLVICRNVIDHSQNPKIIVTETKRVLKARGYFILACYVYTGFVVFLKRVSEILGVFRNIEHPHAFTDVGLKKLCRNHFSIVCERIIYEGKHSTDFGKAYKIKPDRSIINKLVMFINSYIIGNKWFVREYLLLLKMT